MMTATVFLLMAQYGGKAMIPLEVVCADYFHHLSEDKLRRKVALGEIKLPIVHPDASQKSARYVHLTDLAALIDSRHAAAVKEVDQMSSSPKPRVANAANDGR